MVKAVQVFTPTDVPTITYVERSAKDYERELRKALSIPKMIVSISGPSKSGKTVLVRKVVAPDHLIHVYGATIKQPQNLWENAIASLAPMMRSQRARLVCMTHSGAPLRRLAVVAPWRLSGSWCPQVSRWSAGDMHRTPAAPLICTP